MSNAVSTLTFSSAPYLDTQINFSVVFVVTGQAIPKSRTRAVKYYLHLPVDSETLARNVVGLSVAPTGKAEAALFEWITVNSRLRSVRLGGSYKINNRRFDKHR